MGSYTSKPDRFAVYNIFLEVLEGWSSPGPPLNPNDACWADWWHPDGHRVWWDGHNGRFGFVQVNEFNADLLHYAGRGRGWKEQLRRDLQRVVEINMQQCSKCP